MIGHLIAQTIKSQSKRIIQFTESFYCPIVGFNRVNNDWKKVIADAEELVGYPSNSITLKNRFNGETIFAATHLRKFLGTKHPFIETAKKILNGDSHMFRITGLCVLLISKATGSNYSERVANKTQITDNQHSLAEISEMVQLAHILHKGVLNLDILPPLGLSSSDIEFGNKIAVLCGDFLLANASTTLAKLQNTQVVALIATAISDLAKAEFTAMINRNGIPIMGRKTTMKDWEEQVYLSSGSLLAKSLQAALMLTHHPLRLQSAAFELGKNIAYVQHLYEDLLPFQKTSNQSHISLTSAVIILHMESHPQDAYFESLLSDIDTNKSKISSILSSSGSLKKAIRSKRDYAKGALNALSFFPNSDSSKTLSNMVSTLAR